MNAPQTQNPTVTEPLTKKELKALKKKEKKAQKYRKLRKKSIQKGKEGRRLHTIQSMEHIVPFIMKERNDALNYFGDTIEIDRAEEYISEKRKAGYTNFGLMHLFIAAYVRAVSEKPYVNRFIRGQRIYARNGVSICLTVKKEMRADAPDTVVKFHPSVTATPQEIYDEVNRTIESIKSGNDSEIDHILAVVLHVPRLILRATVRFVNFLDYHDLLPKAAKDVLPFYGSCYITSMGSLGIPPIYHHIYNFGNIPLFISFGTKYKEYFLKADGTVGVRRKVDYKMVMDERICDGYAYASALKTMQFYLRHPYKMDTPPAVVVEDID